MSQYTDSISITLTGCSYEVLAWKAQELALMLSRHVGDVTGIKGLAQDLGWETPAPQQPAPPAPPAPQSVQAPAQAPTQQAPAQAAAPPQQAPTAAPPQYTLEQLAYAATPLADAGRQAELQQLLGQYSVRALTQLPKEQYGAFATGLRAMGAKL